MPTAVIVDDMPSAIKNLQTDLESFCPEVEIIGTADSVVAGAKLLRQKTPEILFLDIELGDGSGFDLLEILPDLSAKVIFTTASDEFAIRAFRYAAVDYLLKPIDPDDLMEAVSKATSQNQTTTPQIDFLLEQINQPVSPQRLALHTQEKIRIAEIKDIIRCTADGNYTHFYFTGGEKLLVTRTLKEFDQILEAHQFMRVHQSHLVNPVHVREFLKQDGGYLIMNDGAQVPVSSRKRSQVLKLLEEL